MRFARVGPVANRLENKVFLNCSWSCQRLFGRLKSIRRPHFPYFLRMGEILSKPVTDTHVESEMGKKFYVIAAAMQGFRMTMEDAHKFTLNLVPNISYFAIFDGHNGNFSSIAPYYYISSCLMFTFRVVGKALAHQCADRLHLEILKTAEFKEKNYENALIKAFVDLDEQFITGITFLQCSSF